MRIRNPSTLAILLVILAAVLLLFVAPHMAPQAVLAAAAVTGFGVVALLVSAAVAGTGRTRASPRPRLTVALYPALATGESPIINAYEQTESAGHRTVKTTIRGPDAGTAT